MDEYQSSALQHERHYTVAQANAERAWVVEQVGRVREAIKELSTPEASDVLEAIEPEAGGSYPGREIASSVLTLLIALAELDAKDIVLRDAERGLVDFPSIRDGEEVYLCWLVDEDEIGWWHRPDDGFAGREEV